MKKWQVLAVLALMLLVGILGSFVQSMGNEFQSIMVSGNEVGSDGWNIVNIPLNPRFGSYYQCEISSIDGQEFSVLFSNLSELVNARTGGLPIDFLAERSALNVTSVMVEGRLPDGADVYQLIIVAEPGTIVHIAASGVQGPYPPGLGPVFHAAYWVCSISSISLFFLLLHIYDQYRNERRPGY